MANQAAFQAGIDRGEGGKKKQKSGGKPDTDTGDFGIAAVAKAIPGSFKHGGKVRKTGFAKVHKGEEVLTKAQRKKVARKRG